MATLAKKKVNFDRNNRYKPVLEDVDISSSRNNLTGEVSISINSNPDNGDTEFQLRLSKEDVMKLAWIYKEA